MGRTRNPYSGTKAGLVAGGKERKEGVHTPVQKEDTFSSQLFIWFNDSASKAEVIIDIWKLRKVNYQIHWRPEQNAQYWIHLSATQKRILVDRVQAIITYQSMLEECFVKAFQENEKKRIVRKTTYSSKGPEVTLRDTWAHKNSDFLSMPRELQDVELWPNSIRESQLAGRGFTRTSSTCKELKNFSSRSIISLPKSSWARSTRREHTRRFLTASRIIKDFVQCFFATTGTIRHVVSSSENE